MEQMLGFARRLTLVAAGLILTFSPLGAVAEEGGGSTIQGRIIAAQGGLPVSNATVVLEQGDRQVATTHTDANGSFTIEHQRSGTYSLLIVAAGYQIARMPNVAVTGSIVSIQTALNREQGLKQIAYVASAGPAALQTSSTINTHVDTSILQSENFQRLGDVL